MMQFLSVSLLPLLVAIAGIGDVFSYRIPNWLTGLIALLFFPMAAMTGLGGEAIMWHLITGLGVLACGFGLFAFGFIGGGDAKLLAATALWFGWPVSMVFLIYTSLAGGVLAIIYSIYRTFRIESEVRAISWLKRWTSFEPNLPYGLAIAVGTILAFPQSWWMQAAHS